LKADAVPAKEDIMKFEEWKVAAGKNPFFPFKNAADKKLADIILKAGMTNTPVNELLQFLQNVQCPEVTLTKHDDVTEYLKKMPLEGFQDFNLTPEFLPNITKKFVLHYKNVS